ncbi:hypothetical protein GQ53DRAFT_138709 [Thozetella sp. PMI_491]|nr:hypothetical protein GQ53DRAFT_138709 [Thozetella sp. PMI_491]
MGTTSSGRIAKRRPKNSTPHQRNHRWESFSTKIDKFRSLDPLRKVRRHDLEEEDLSATTSYLRNGLEKWRELNVSRQYLNFGREILPLTDSLAQILHFEDRIMDLLSEYISKQDKDALEPLLDLLTAFAHDLGIRFEKHYPRALQLIVDIASKPQGVEVIEWTFAALAFLFKYLSRLLVPNLVPTYDAVSKLMGKKKNPGYIARSAAEALSFLIKKAAAPSQREHALPVIVQHARKDLMSLAGERQFELYSQGIMTMFAEACKGPGNTLHSTAPETFTCLIRTIPTSEIGLVDETIWTDVCCGVLTSIIHHSTEETFKNLEIAVVEETELDSQNPWRALIHTRLLGILAGVRKGYRIQNWTALVKSFCKALGRLSLVKQADRDTRSLLVWRHAMINTAIVWNQATMEALIPSVSALNGAMNKEPLMRWYIPFCSYFAELNPDRFRSLFQKDLQRFIVSHWSEDANEDLLSVLIPRMVESNALPGPHEKELFPLPQSWQDQIVNKFVRLEDTPFPEKGGFGKDEETWRDKCLPKYSALLQVLEFTSIHPSTRARIAEVLLKKLKLAVRPSSSLPTDEAQFIASDGFRAYLWMTKAAGSLDLSLKPLLRAAAPRFSRSTGFVNALLAYEKETMGSSQLDKKNTSESESPQPQENPLMQCLIDNLSTESRDLRLASLQLLETLESASGASPALSLMIQIEQTPLDIQNIRTIAVHLRKLGQLYTHLGEGSWLLQAVPSFLFGMMTVPLSPVWDEAVETMKQVVSHKTGEEALGKIAFDWLDMPSMRWGSPSKTIAAERQVLTDFECLNMMQLERSAQLTTQVIEDPAEGMRESFEQGQEAVPSCSERARSKTLKVLSALPAVAEKRSRMLIPHLFAWNKENDALMEGSDEGDDISPDSAWSFVDRKSLVGIFAQFNNPRALYQSDKVYDIYLRLVANGNIEMQKLALKAIFTWKHDGIKPYREHFEYLLDESRFKNELTVLFQGDNQIRLEHHARAMPVLLRLLYGRSVSKKGAASGRGGLHATRLAIIRHLSVEDTGSFLDIALGELRDIRVVENSAIQESLFEHDLIQPRKQVGVLNMLEAIINELGTSISLYMEKLVNSVLYCLILACRRLEGVGDEAEEPDAISFTSLYRSARTTSLKCLSKLFQNAQSFDWTPYQEAIVGEIISPRIDKLPAETTQGVSGTMKLLSTWSALPKPAMFFSTDSRMLPKLIECIALEKTKDEVKIYVLDIVRNLVRLAQAPATESEYNDLIRSELLQPNIDLILKEIGSLLREQRDIGRDLLSAAVSTVVDLSEIVDTATNVRDMMDISSLLLNEPSRRVNPKIKGAILLILKRFLGFETLQEDKVLVDQIYQTISSLFGFFKDKTNRQTLCEVLLALAYRRPWLQEVAEICADLNSYAENTLDELDFNKRLAAFGVLSRPRDKPLTLEQWTPLLHNMVFYILNDEDFGVLSSNAADGICKFVESVKVSTSTSEEKAFFSLLSSVVLPGIYSGAKNESETVRREYLRVLSFLVSQLPTWAPVADLTPLNVSADDETDNSFFFHILSPAVSRQLQAVKLLEDANDNAQLSSKNISQIFIPLLEHFILGRADNGDDHGLGAQATIAIGKLAAALEWQSYRFLLKRYISFVESKPEHQRQLIRLLERVGGALQLAKEQKGDEELPPLQACRLSRTLPAQEKINDEVNNNFLPTLLKYLHEKDESTVSARVPVGIIIVKLLKLLPSQGLGDKLPGVLTDICHILRSKAPESRDMARDTLAKIAVILGPGSFGFIVQELRGALLRGYQLHVLSYTLHSLLTVVMPQIKQGELDYCLEPIMAIIMDDIFGTVGQEKDAEGYVSQMKEVKGSKSQDSMELIAKNSSINCLVHLVSPLQALLSEKIDLRTVRKIDELLTRITAGLLHNPAAESRETLVFCYEVIQEVYNSQKQESQPKIDARLKRYLYQKGAKKSDRAMTSRYTYKLVRFSLDIVRSVVKKHDGLRNAGNISGFLPILGDAVLSGEEEVKIAALKLFTVIVKVPFKTNDLADAYKVALKEATKAISQSTSMGSDLAQTALKLISVILRDRREVQVKDAAVDMLLGRIKDDLTVPLYRHVTFNFLRAVLERKVETALVYDTLDYVGTVMVTNDDKDTRDLARGAFFHFLRDYPQKKNRWGKQIAFIVANLKYEREGGRLSIMEVVHLLLMKSADEFVQEVSATCFIPLVFVIANDDSEKCRAAAGELIKEIFRKANKETLQKFLALMRSWAEQEGNAAVMKLGLQAFGFYFETKDSSPKDRNDLALVYTKIADVLSDESTRESDWDLTNTSLLVVQTLLSKHPTKILGESSVDLWRNIKHCLSDSTLAVQLTAIKLLSMYLADFARNVEKGSVAEGFLGSHGAILTKDDIAELVRLNLNLLTADEVDEVLSEEVVRILVFLGRYLDLGMAGSDHLEREEEDGEPDVAAEQESRQRTDLESLLWELTRIVRKETRPNLQSLVPKTAAMSLLEAFCNTMPKAAILPSAKTILRPLRNLTDPDIPGPYSTNEIFKERYDALKTKAAMIMETLRKKLGTEVYTAMLQVVGRGVKDKRTKRASKRHFEAITQPEKHGKDKKRKHDKTKERRKEKGQMHRDLRRGYL